MKGCHMGIGWIAVTYWGACFEGVCVGKLFRFNYWTDFSTSSALQAQAFLSSNRNNEACHCIGFHVPLMVFLHVGMYIEQLISWKLQCSSVRQNSLFFFGHPSKDAKILSVNEPSCKLEKLARSATFLAVQLSLMSVAFGPFHLASCRALWWQKMFGRIGMINLTCFLNPKVRPSPFSGVLMRIVVWICSRNGVKERLSLWFGMARGRLVPKSCETPRSTLWGCTSVPFLHLCSFSCQTPSSHVAWERWWPFYIHLSKTFVHELESWCNGLHCRHLYGNKVPAVYTQDDIRSKSYILKYY